MPASEIETLLVLVLLLFNTTEYEKYNPANAKGERNNRPSGSRNSESWPFPVDGNTSSTRCDSTLEARTRRYEEIHTGLRLRLRLLCVCCACANANAVFCTPHKSVYEVSLEKEKRRCRKRKEKDKTACNTS